MSFLVYSPDEMAIAWSEFSDRSLETRKYRVQIGLYPAATFDPSPAVTDLSAKAIEAIGGAVFGEGSAPSFGLKLVIPTLQLINTLANGLEEAGFFNVGTRFEAQQEFYRYSTTPGSALSTTPTVLNSQMGARWLVTDEAGDLFEYFVIRAELVSATPYTIVTLVRCFAHGGRAPVILDRFLNPPLIGAHRVTIATFCKLAGQPVKAEQAIDIATFARLQTIDLGANINIDVEPNCVKITEPGIRGGITIDVTTFGLIPNEGIDGTFNVDTSTFCRLESRMVEGAQTIDVETSAAIPPGRLVASLMWDISTSCRLTELPVTSEQTIDISTDAQLETQILEADITIDSSTSAVLIDQPIVGAISINVETAGPTTVPIEGDTNIDVATFARLQSAPIVGDTDIEVSTEARTTESGIRGGIAINVETAGPTTVPIEGSSTIDTATGAILSPASPKSSTTINIQTFANIVQEGLSGTFNVEVSTEARLEEHGLVGASTIDISTSGEITPAGINSDVSIDVGTEGELVPENAWYDESVIPWYDETGEIWEFE